MKEMNAQYFIDLFEPIPESEWGTGHYVSADGTKKCALGHCGMINIDSTPAALKRFHALSTLFALKLLSVPHVNDGHTYADSSQLSLVPAHSELGSTPKQRILTVLRRLKKEGH